jgi:hypothetical protein
MLPHIRRHVKRRGNLSGRKFWLLVPAAGDIMGMLKIALRLENKA